MKRESKSKRRNSILIVAILLIIIAFFFFTLYKSDKDRVEAKDFTLTDLDGETFSLSDFKGKVVIIDFMATWCKPCLIETANLIEIWQIYEDELTIISLDADPTETEEQLSIFKEDFPEANWIWAMDTSTLAYDYKITTIPTIIIFDKEGKIASRHEGITDNQILIDEIANLIKEG